MLASNSSVIKIPGHIMKIKTDEITSIIKKEIQSYKQDLKIDEVGTVVEVGDGIARVFGLKNVMSGELVEFQNGVKLL